MSVAASPSSERERAMLRDRVARARLQVAARPEVASAGTGRADTKDRCAVGRQARPAAGASILPPLPLAPSRFEEIAEPVRASSLAELDAAVSPAPLLELVLLEPPARARAVRMLEAIGDTSPASVDQACRVALELERRCRR